jgi:hypothetical protein
VYKVPFENERVVVVGAFYSGPLWWRDLEHVGERLGLLKEDTGDTEQDILDLRTRCHQRNTTLCSWTVTYLDN